MTDKDREAFEQQCPEKIYLLDMGEDMPVWCDDASPDYDDRFSVEYIRADVARAESAKEIAEKDAEIERLKRVTEWQPIETAPKDGTEVIVSDGRDVFTARYRLSNCANDEPFFAVSGDGDFFNRGTDWNFEPDYRWPTHWMPLPDAPNTKKEG
jgi:hypothetical protein